MTALIGRVVSSFASHVSSVASSAFDINQATLSGAIDIIVIENEDGTLLSTPFHVRFGKLQVLRSHAKLVTVIVNEEKTNLQMKLGRAGEAFFVLPTDEPVEEEWVTSPISSPVLSPDHASAAAQDLEPLSPLPDSAVAAVNPRAYSRSLASSEVAAVAAEAELQSVAVEQGVPPSSATATAVDSNGLPPQLSAATSLPASTVAPIARSAFTPVARQTSNGSPSASPHTVQGGLSIATTSTPPPTSPAPNSLSNSLASLGVPPEQTAETPHSDGESLQQHAHTRTHSFASDAPSSDGENVFSPKSSTMPSSVSRNQLPPAVLQQPAPQLRSASPTGSLTSLPHSPRVDLHANGAVSAPPEQDNGLPSSEPEVWWSWGWGGLPVRKAARRHLKVRHESLTEEDEETDTASVISAPRTTNGTPGATSPHPFAASNPVPTGGEPGQNPQNPGFLRSIFSLFKGKAPIPTAVETAAAMAAGGAVAVVDALKPKEDVKPLTLTHSQSDSPLGDSPALPNGENPVNLSRSTSGPAIPSPLPPNASKRPFGSDLDLQILQSGSGLSTRATSSPVPADSIGTPAPDLSSPTVNPFSSPKRGESLRPGTAGDSSPAHQRSTSYTPSSHRPSRPLRIQRAQSPAAFNANATTYTSSAFASYSPRAVTSRVKRSMSPSPQTMRSEKVPPLDSNNAMLPPSFTQATAPHLHIPSHHAHPHPQAASASPSASPSVATLHSISASPARRQLRSSTGSNASDHSNPGADGAEAQPVQFATASSMFAESDSPGPHLAPATSVDSLASNSAAWKSVALPDQSSPRVLPLSKHAEGENQASSSQLNIDPSSVKSLSPVDESHTPITAEALQTPRQPTVAAAATPLKSASTESLENPHALQPQGSAHSLADLADDEATQSDGEEIEDPAPWESLEMSLCGSLLARDDSVGHALFDEHRVTFEQLSNDPSVVSRPDLVFRYGGKLYPAHVALPLLLSQLVFGQPLHLTDEGLKKLRLSRKDLDGQVDTKSTVDDGLSSLGAEPSNSPLVGSGSQPAIAVPAQGPSGRRMWLFDWFRPRPAPSASLKDSPSQPPASAPPSGSAAPSVGTLTPSSSATLNAAAPAAPVAGAPTRVAKTDKPAGTPVKIPDPHSHGGHGTHATSWRSFPQLDGLNTKPPEPAVAAAPEEVAELMGDQSQGESREQRPPKAFQKSLRPTQEMLRSLNLRPGRNVISFLVTSNLQGPQEVSAAIYLWKPTTKIVVSDIDGTITKSDVLGNVMPLIGRDWSHPGVASLFTNIKRNGYEVLYLTSRAIGQANITRGYIQNLRQGEFTLPDGPVIMSPDRLIQSFKREVVYRRPQEFKIIALRDVRLLFAAHHNPFYAGFGNRVTDVVAYRAVGVPLNRIFIINRHGDISQANTTVRRTYLSLNDMVDDIFPSYETHKAETVDPEFNTANYWKSSYADELALDDVV